MTTPAEAAKACARVRMADNSAELFDAVERFLAVIGESENAKGETYEETAERLDSDIMRLAAEKWHIFEGNGGESPALDGFTWNIPAAMGQRCSPKARLP